MRTSIAVLSIFMSAAWAQSLIPTGISNSCSDFINALNSDSSLSSCIDSLARATSAYGPLAPHGNRTIASMTSALDTFCTPATMSSCSATAVRAKLGEFYAACTKELSSEPNNDVIRMYDTFYAIMPLKEAVCSKDDNGRYCVTEISKGTHTKRSLVERAPGDQVAFIPNATSIASSNLLFLYLKGDMPSEKLCTTCTKNVLSAYMGFESTVPYAPGLAQSVLLRGQIELYEGVNKTCGQTFLGSAVQAAAGLGSGIFGDSANVNGAHGAAKLQIATLLSGLLMIGCALVL